MCAVKKLAVLFLAAWYVVGLRPAAAQGLTGALIGTVKDHQGGVLPGAIVRVSSPALIGAARTQSADDKGQWRFSALPPGTYVLDIELSAFAPFHDEVRIDVGTTIERTAVLTLAGVTDSIVVEGSGSRIDARTPGFATAFGTREIQSIPTRRASMFDVIRMAPGISPTSPSSGTNTTVSAFGSGTNENQFLIDGTNFTCPCNGVARAEPGVDFIEGVQVQSAGASAEYGNVQGAVINVVTRQGGEHLLGDAAYYAQAAALTSQPVMRPLAPPLAGQSGYERAKYRDAVANVGGPVVHDRLWFFTGYEYLRDSDSQPGTDPTYPRTYEQNKLFGKLTWRLGPGWQLVQSLHYERWVNPDPPTAITPFEATLRRSASVPAMTFAHLTHTPGNNTVWEARVSRFVYQQDALPSTGDLTIANHSDSVTGISRGAPPSFSELTITRTTGQASISHYRSGLLGADHQVKGGVQVERGGHHAINGIPTGVRYVDAAGQPSQAIATAPFNVGALFVTTGLFLTDAVTIGDRLTINAGVRYDHTRAISQDLPSLDANADETDQIISGRGTLYTWNPISPRLGVTAKITSDGRTILRASYGRFSQGVMTGELEPFHPGATATTTSDFVPATGAYTQIRSVVDPATNLLLDGHTKPPTTDEYSIGVDREIGRGVAAAVAYIHKSGTDFIGWTDVGGVYRDEVRTLRDGRTVPVLALVNGTAARRFLLTNPAGYALRYDGVVSVIEKRFSTGWQAFGSYTWSRASGLQPSSGTTAAGAQVSTVSPPQPLTFGRDPNDLTNAYGRLPNDRPHMLRMMGSVAVPRSGVVVAANFQYFSGKPWAATALVSLPQSATYRLLLEPRGSRRLSSQSLLDLRVSRSFGLAGAGRVEVLLDILNVLNDTAEEGIATDNLFSPTFAQPTLFVDPRRAMLAVRINLGR